MRRRQSSRLWDVEAAPPPINIKVRPGRQIIAARMMMMTIPQRSRRCVYVAIATATAFIGFLRFSYFIGVAPNQEHRSIKSFSSMYWLGLDEEARDAATILGYNEELWDGDDDEDPPIFGTPFANLHSREKEAARYLNMVDQFPLFHSNGVQWSSLNVPAQDAAALLGYDEVLWNQNYPIPILMNRTQRLDVVPSRLLRTIRFLGLDHYYDLSRLQTKNGNYNTPRYIDNTNMELVKNQLQTELQDLANQKILLYITTHMSDLHRSALEYVWPHAVNASNLLSQADVLLHYSATTSAEEQEEQLNLHHLMKTAFGPSGNNVTILHSRQNPGYQEGAIKAISDALENNWFTPYDWIIRVNPDVIIRNDTWIIHQMLDKEKVGAILVDCGDQFLNSANAKVHTDFSIFQPKYIQVPEEAKRIANAEKHFSKIIEEVWTTGRAAILPDNDPNDGICRVRGHKSSVVHDHEWLDGMIQCFNQGQGIYNFTKCNSLNS
eukprot:scaffold3114_cov130-Skeletonema_dohrnii-CCMP3373.AAC.1